MKRYKSALVLGLGVSGEAAAKLLLSEGTRVAVIDNSNETDLAKRAENLDKQGVAVILGSDVVPEEKYDVCVISPGVAGNSEWVKTVESRWVETISELELGASRCECPMLAVTGSNGKSTMVKICGEAMRHAGCRTAFAGNYGSPLCEVVASSADLDWVVCEVSSFQLEKVKDFRPRVGVLLNIQPDHLDRHGDMKTYVEMKIRLFARMKKSDVGIVLDEKLKEVAELSAGGNRWVTFGLSEQADYRYENGCVYFDNHGLRESVSITGTLFDNEIMGVMAAAAFAAIRACGPDYKAVDKALRGFNPLPHRMQEIAVINGVRFVDDSKATNLSALCAALKMSAESVRLIAGGLLKEKNLKSVKKLLAKKTKKVYLIGQAAREMEAAWQDIVECCSCVGLEKAVQTAWKDARRGETILLSPGCASFDQFKNFEDRGDQFKRMVMKLDKEN